MLGRNAIVAAKRPLGLVPEVLDSVDGIAPLGEQFGMVDPVMAEFRHVDGVIGFPAIAVDHRIWLYSLGYDRHQRLAGGIGNDLGVDLPAAFEQAKDGDLAACASTPFAFAMASEVAFINFNFAIEGRFVFNFLSDHRPDFLVVQRRGMAIDSYQFCRRSGCHSADEQFKQLILLVNA